MCGVMIVSVQPGLRRDVEPAVCESAPGWAGGSTSASGQELRPAIAPGGPGRLKATMKLLPILLVEDEENDVIFLRLAFREVGILNPVNVVRSVGETKEYLVGAGRFGDRTLFPGPCLVLCEFRMARTAGGLEVLKFIRAKPNLHHLIVILWSCGAPVSAIKEAYECGVNSCLTKPCDQRDLVKLASSIKTFWLEQNQWFPESEASGW